MIKIAALHKQQYLYKTLTEQVCGYINKEKKTTGTLYSANSIYSGIRF